MFSSGRPLIMIYLNRLNNYMKSCTFIDYVLKGRQPVTQWSIVYGLKHSTLVQASTGLLPIYYELQNTKKSYLKNAN